VSGNVAADSDETRRSVGNEYQMTAQETAKSLAPITVRLVTGTCADQLLNVWPILFIMYMADLLRLIYGMELHSRLYADDTQIYGSCARDAALPSSSAFQLVSSARWMQANTPAVEYLQSYGARHLGAKNKLYLPNILLLIGSDKVQPVRCVRNLGIYIDCDLSMRSHVSKAVSNCFAALRRLRSIRRLVSELVLGNVIDHDATILWQCDSD